MAVAIYMRFLKCSLPAGNNFKLDLFSFIAQKILYSDKYLCNIYPDRTEFGAYINTEFRQDKYSAKRSLTLQNKYPEKKDDRLYLAAVEYACL
jgi:hypothetical protein